MTAELKIYATDEMGDLYYSADYLRCQGNYLREDNYLDAREKARCYESAAAIYQRMGHYLDSEERARECRVLSHEWKDAAEKLYQKYLYETRAFGPFDVVAMILGGVAACLPVLASHFLMAVGA
ncbi:MAG: hypothetical protein LBC38_02025 [Oscillospiraceae bacterium]|jgi:hypothetical protein|nr:hypothetical protein [Oscillospiraceae bacterium]